MEIRAKNEQVRQILQAAARNNTNFLDSISDHAIRTAVCSSGCTPLHWAAGSNQLEMLDYLVFQRRLFSVDIPAVKKSRGRTSFHYSCRNGFIDAGKWLVQNGAQVDLRAKQGVTPFQLAVWQNRLEVCQWLVDDQGVDPCQLNDFDCGAVHWLGICPLQRASDDSLLPLARWLAQQPGIDFTLKQRQGHTPLHKAAWGGHLALIQYLRNEHGLWDDFQDDAGNFGADLADMADTPHHDTIARYLREQCSRARSHSCAILGVEATASRSEIRSAYLEKARIVHPDRQQGQATGNKDNDNGTRDFDTLQKAYVHLMEKDGRGNQSNPSHSLNLMLQVSGCQQTTATVSEMEDDSCFKARLIAVLLEYGDKGLDLSNIKKKWKQVWPQEPFPSIDEKKNKKPSLSEFLVERAGDVIQLVNDEKGCVRVYAKNCSQAKVREAAKSTCSTPLNPLSNSSVVNAN